MVQLRQNCDFILQLVSFLQCVVVPVSLSHDYYLACDALLWLNSRFVGQDDDSRPTFAKFFVGQCILGVKCLKVSLSTDTFIAGKRVYFGLDVLNIGKSDGLVTML